MPSPPKPQTYLAVTWAAAKLLQLLPCYNFEGHGEIPAQSGVGQILFRHHQIFLMFRRVGVKQTQAKLGVALQTPLSCSESFGEWVTLFVPWLYGATKPKLFGVKPPVIEYIMFHRFGAFLKSRNIKIASLVQKLQQFSEWMVFSNGWSWIGNNIHMQAVQQACFCNVVSLWIGLEICLVLSGRVWDKQVYYFSATTTLPNSKCLLWCSIWDHTAVVYNTKLMPNTITIE